MSEPEKTIKVVDRRLFTADGDLREEFVEEMAAAAAAPEAPPTPPPAPETKIPTDPAFLRLLDMLAQTASLYLEGVPDATGRRHVDLTAARQIVDSLVSLREKARGRLSFEETDSLEGLIGELQLVFARYAQAAAPPKAGGGAPTAPASEARLIVAPRPGRAALALALLLTACVPSVGAAQVLGAPGESTELAFRREVRGHWFGWLAAQEEADARLTKTKIDDIMKHAQRVGIRRMSDLALSATFLGRRELHGDRIEQARLCFDAALRLDPDLPEARWGRLSLALATHSFGDVPGELSGALRTTLVDVESRRIAVYRFWLLLALAACGVAAAFTASLAVAHARRYGHDLYELAGRFVPGAETPLALGLFFLPLLLSFDVVWWALVLIAALLGYATRAQRVAVAVALALTLPLFPLLDAAAYDLSVAASPILRGAEALRELRYDQRVIDDLEAVKSSLPDDVDIRFLLGRLYQFLGQNDRAITEYSTGAQVSPTDSRCLVNRGNIRFVDGDFGSAQEDFQEALKRSSRNIYARYNLALVYAETFRTVEAASTLQEARALDARLVQKFQESQTLVKVVSMDFTPDEAMAKIERLEHDARTRRILGQYRGYEASAGLKVPYLFGVLAALGAAYGLDVWRRKGRGYASECQKCGRTFCRLCKPHGENEQLCSQCIHVYLRKDGVAIETKLQKVEEVRRRKWIGEKVRLAVNVVLPGSSAFIDSRVASAAGSLFLFFLGISAVLFRETLVVSPRPSILPEAPGSVVFGLVALAGWVLGQRSGRRG